MSVLPGIICIYYLFIVTQYFKMFVGNRLACKTKFKHKITPTRHMQRHDGLLFSSLKCPKVYTRKDRLGKHVKTVHCSLANDGQRVEQPTHSISVPPVSTKRTSHKVTALDSNSRGHGDENELCARSENSDFFRCGGNVFVHKKF